MTKLHATLGASSAHRWWACPGSIRLSEGLPDQQSVYAAEGTAAHELGERCLRSGFDAERFLGEAIVIGENTFEVDAEMAEAVQVYLDEVRRRVLTNVGSNELEVERKFDLGSLYPGMFGTNDASIYNAETGKLVVLDYKHGRGHPVEVKDNPQLLYYAYGAAIAEKERRLSEIEMIIVQPRAPHRDGPVRTWSVDPVFLLDWSADLVDAAKRTEDPAAPLAPGDHCTFCRAAAICPALREQSLLAAQLDFDAVDAPKATDLEPAELSAILIKADMIEEWLHAVRAHALTVLEKGGEVPGFKLVAKRTNRKWVGDLYPEKDLRNLGVPEDSLYEKKPLTPAKAEALIPKPRRSEIEKLTFKPPGGNTLAPDSDNRSARNAGTPQSEFTAV